MDSGRCVEAVLGLAGRTAVADLSMGDGGVDE